MTDTATMKICPDCYGSGVCNANADPCWRCDGSGGVPADSSDNQDGQPSEADEWRDFDPEA